MKRIIFLLVCLATILGVQAQQRKTPFNGILMDFNENPIKNQIYHVPVAHCKSLSIILNTESGEVLASESQELIEKGFDHVTRRERHLGTIIS